MVSYTLFSFRQNLRAASIFCLESSCLCSKIGSEPKGRMINIVKRLRPNGISSWSKLEPDMVFEIFKRLSNRTLANCEVVSKSWLSLIRSPDFVEYWFRFRLSEKKIEYIIFPFFDCNMVLIRTGMNGEGFEEVFFPELNELCLFMICSYNGLVCCTNSVLSTDDTVKTDFYVLNPATRETFLLPECGPSKVEPAYGVAFGPKLHEYKVFRFYESANKSDEKSAEKCKECEIYSSSIGLWSNIGIVLQCPKGPMESTHIFINGKVYWFISSEGNSSIPSTILSVDSEENFQTISLPDQATVYSFLVDIEGLLSVVFIYPDNGYSVEIWVLRNCNPCIWAKKCSSSIPIDHHGHINSIAVQETDMFFIIPENYIIFHLDDRSWTPVEEETAGATYESIFKHVVSRVPCNGVYQPQYIQ